MDRNGNRRDFIKGISVANPVDVEREYLLKTADYAILNGYNHFQINGPIHNPVKGNIDGIIFNRKYSQFNGEKDAEYVKLNLSVLNEACDKLSAAGVKSYMWHHELELPADFGKEFPQILNENGDIEVSHPLVEDYLKNKIRDFFFYYPKMNGIILTLHETRIPLLKLKNQKLGKLERVKLVTKILFDECAALGKELIVRPFASVEEDYEMMLNAYEDISPDMPVMDKWTQFDWSLTLPDNAFFKKIKNNPLLVETDVFGEYFGKGRLPVMLKKHIEEKFGYCEKFAPLGYVNRIDRDGRNAFGNVNEVNLEIMRALLSGENSETAVDEFFKREYGDAAEAIKTIMEPTQDLNRRLLNVKNYYFMQGSYFPELNHCKNHFYFDIMKEKCQIASDEWFIPKNWERGSIQSVFEEKDGVIAEAQKLLEKVKQLKGAIVEDKFNMLLTQFNNLYYAARVWRGLIDVLYYYVKFFETGEQIFENKLFESLEDIKNTDEEGRRVVGDNDDYYMNIGCFSGGEGMHVVKQFADDVKESFLAEKNAYARMRNQPVTDFVICGGAMEGHKLQKEVNFSDTLNVNGRPCRIPGNKNGAEWSRVNAHGWFSYCLNIKPYAENKIIFDFGSLTDKINVQITVGDEIFNFDRTAKESEFTIAYEENKGENSLRVRIDRVSGHTPLLYTIIVK